MKYILFFGHFHKPFAVRYEPHAFLESLPFDTAVAVRYLTANGRALCLTQNKR